MALKKIGFLCVGLKGWISLERTKSFYIESLENTYEIILIHSEKEFFEKLDSFDIVLNFFGNLVWEHKHKIKTPVIFCLHGGAVLNYKFLVNNAEKVSAHDAFIVNCTSDIAILKEVFVTPPNIHLLKLPISKDIELNYAKNDCKSVFNINEDTLLLGYVARILPQKNLHHAIHMLNKVKNEITTAVKLIVIGDYWVDYPILNWQKTENEYHTYINELIASYQLSENIIQFQSNLSNDELTLCYGALDFLIHPTNSLDENFGYAPIEAMKCGTPVIGTAYGGLKDSIVHEKTGFLLDTWSSASGIRSDYFSGLNFIKKLHGNSALKQEVTNNCLERAEAHYSFKSCAQNLVEIVNSSTNSKLSTISMTGNLDFLTYTENVYLPKVKPSWNYYKKVAQIYCNTSIENIEFSSTLFLRTFSKFTILEQQIIFEDPTWPAKIPFNTQTEEILKACETTTNYNQLKEKLSFELDHTMLLNLISIGALVFSQHKTP
ncbi:glycosyltransferase family 4 protein [Kordia sp. YSTF-M3]|uniref:Glycosyltransferase family 4 protein n=1 Tax=Kordia aestuariivivens TaxID=2759037 RepID=A0ABR7Q6A1_9FLAO|nr:glycosyltransferase family 4 protein [Kordia aestuariivivens]MBC8754090.1 glycosyltransferase family 4 protein [Kordia aestuariivivens]